MALSINSIPFPNDQPVLHPRREDLVLREEPLLRLRRWQPEAASAAPRLREADG